MERIVYEIRVKGRLDMDWVAWFSGVTITNMGEEEILLSGELPDQSALHGLLAQIRDLNLTLISVQRVENLEKGLGQTKEMAC
jgi:hypothetical protein